MAKRSYSSSPDGSVGVVDIDHGDSDNAMKKQADVVTEASFIDRERERDGAREIDAAVEGMSLTRAAKDLHRAYPRSTSHADIHRRMERRLPSEIELRRSMSSRQRKARSVTKRQVLEAMPNTQHRALSRLVQEPQRWAEVNASLSKVNGDAVQLDDKDRQHVQRVDRAIQAYEKTSGRGHIVYTEVTMPDSIAVREQLPGSLSAGTVVSFDRFTMTRHNLHELDAERGSNDLALEIQTSRGMYLGMSDTAGGNTAHLLPRGIRLEVVAAHYAPYERNGGSMGERLVVQMREVPDPDPADGER
ncbi:hypothetical protein JWS13_00240 (plasmid) [Rhodococcus pseudokoreensis]|uniref:ADP-ribosyltransferase exoenzyme n=2 Tax=Nocardiaceae TaxID=85025 RepID=A0A974ZQX3_9NOCA|nr:hypothetical protein JWS13_00240 [Rhodococcus pseudokoreensis]